MYSLRKLLTLAVGEAVKVTELFGYREPVSGEAPPIGRSVEILYQHVDNPSAREIPNHRDMLFVLPDMDERFGEHIVRWFERVPELGRVLDLYFSTQGVGQHGGQHPIAPPTQPTHAGCRWYGPGRDRTCDLGIKSPLLYRLSYRPAAVECRSGRLRRLYTPTRPPSTSGLGHHPFKVAARVRIPLGAPRARSRRPRC